MKPIQQLQRAILHRLLDSVSEYTELYPILTPSDFWWYGRVWDFLQKNGRKKAKIDGIPTKEICDYCWVEMMVELLTPDYSIILSEQKSIVELITRNLEVDLKWKFNLEKVSELQERIEKIRIALSWRSLDRYNPESIYTELMEEIAMMDGKEWLMWYSTGIHSLDVVSDGLQRGTVMRLSAYSNVGKSKLSYHICNSILRQKANIIYFSLEVAKRRVMQNLMMNWYDLSYWDITRWRWTTMIDPTDLFRSNITIIDDVYSLEAIVSIVESKKPDVVFIDFVQNINTPSSGEYEKMTKIATAIQQMAIVNNLAVFDLSQVSNDVSKYTDGSPIPAKWSGALIASADIVLLMTRDQQLEMNILTVAKNKFWPNGKKILLDFDFSRGKVTDKGKYEERKKNF